MTERAEIGRLALRHEGQWWNAYWTPHQDSMSGAVLMGSIRIGLAGGKAKEQFMAAMKSAFDSVVQDVAGQTPVWSAPMKAPESERPC